MAALSVWLGSCTWLAGPGPVASVVVSPDSIGLLVGGIRQLGVVLRDAAGDTLTDGPVAWFSDNPAVVSVSGAGVVTGLAPGVATVRAARNDKSGSAGVAVFDSGQDFAIASARLTQGVQAPDGAIPMVLKGDAAAVDVLVRANWPSSLRTTIVLRMYDGYGRLAWSDTTSSRGPLGPDPSDSAPSAQLLVPSEVLGSVAEWQVLRDPAGLLPDDSAGDDVFPREGRALVNVVTVPPLELRFVPIVLAAGGGASGDVSQANLPEYLRTLKSVYPLGVVTAVIGTPLTTSASFGTPPSGGDAAFWTQVLGELDLARLASGGDPATYWYGVVRPPAGFTYSAYGGEAYIPTDGGSTGAGTRTALGVQVGWFSDSTQARDLVAHELGHTFGRRHAPCGVSSGLDPNFPRADGTIGAPELDVYDWAAGYAESAGVVPSSTGDVMGYCHPVWASAYSYRGVLAFRHPLVTAVGSRRTSVLAVRGSVAEGSGIRLEPAFLLNAPASLPHRPGNYHLEGLTATGKLLFGYDFSPATIAEAATVRYFAFLVPLDSVAASSLSEVRVRGRQGVARLTRLRGPAAGAALRGAPASVTRAGDGMIDVGCPAGVTRGVLVLDAASGDVLGTAAAASMRVMARRGTPLVVACSDGVGTARTKAVAP